MSKNLYRYFNIYYWLRKFSFSRIFQIIFFFNNNIKRKIIFYLIYKSSHWRDYNKIKEDESISGLGSDIKVTKKLIFELENFIKYNKINSLLDIACGDFLWMNKLITKNINLDYLGLEIVDDIVNKNNLLYSNSKIKFECADVLKNEIPKNYDLILVRDFFIHIKNQDIINMIKKIKLTNCKYLAINNFPHISKNTEVKGYGHHRLINIEIEPFNLTNAYKVIEDHDRKLNIYKIN